MRIGIDFDNTIICYDELFCNLAKSWQLIPENFQGSKRELRDAIRELPEGDTHWQRMQGQAYGSLITGAKLFPGVKEFVESCNQHKAVEVFIVSHKTEFGHYDEKRVSLRSAAIHWLRSQGFFDVGPTHIKEENIFFATTREEKIERIKALHCSHFIDDLVEVLDAPTFPKQVKCFLFQPTLAEPHQTLKNYAHWNDIKNAIFNS